MFAKITVIIYSLVLAFVQNGFGAEFLPQYLKKGKQIEISNLADRFLVHLLCLSGQEMAPTGQKPLLKGLLAPEMKIVPGATC